MCSLINKQLLLTAYAYLFIMEQQKGQQGSEALQIKGSACCRPAGGHSDQTPQAQELQRKNQQSGQNNQQKKTQKKKRQNNSQENKASKSLPTESSGSSKFSSASSQSSSSSLDSGRSSSSSSDDEVSSTPCPGCVEEGRAVVAMPRITAGDVETLKSCNEWVTCDRCEAAVAFRPFLFPEDGVWFSEATLGRAYGCRIHDHDICSVCDEVAKAEAKLKKSPEQQHLAECLKDARTAAADQQKVAGPRAGGALRKLESERKQIQKAEDAGALLDNVILSLRGQPDHEKRMETLRNETAKATALAEFEVLKKQFEASKMTQAKFLNELQRLKESAKPGWPVSLSIKAEEQKAREV